MKRDDVITLLECQTCKLQTCCPILPVPFVFCCFLIADERTLKEGMHLLNGDGVLAHCKKRDKLVIMDICAAVV